MVKRAEKGVLVGYEGNLIYYIWLSHTQRVIRLFLVIFIEDLLSFKLIINIYIEMILSDYIIDGVDLESSNSKESISGIGFGGVMMFAPGTKYHQGIKGSDIEIYVLSSI